MRAVHIFVLNTSLVIWLSTTRPLGFSRRSAGCQRLAVVLQPWPQYLSLSDCNILQYQSEVWSFSLVLQDLQDSKTPISTFEQHPTIPPLAAGATMRVMLAAKTAKVVKDPRQRQIGRNMAKPWKSMKSVRMQHAYLILSHLISSDLIWSHLISSDLIWSHLISSDFIWFHLSKSTKHKFAAAKSSITTHVYRSGSNCEILFCRCICLMKIRFVWIHWRWTTHNNWPFVKS